MKKSALKKKRIANRSKMAIAATATMMAVPMLGIPVNLKAQSVDKNPSLQHPLGPANPGQQPSSPHLKFADIAQKLPSSYSIAGIDGEHLVFRKTGGELFYLDEAGDMKFVSAGEYYKYEGVKSSAEYLRKKLPGKMKSGTITIQRIKFDDLYLKDKGMYGKVTFLGEDAGGHDVIKTSSGQTVYLDPVTGDFVPVSLNLGK